MQFNSGDCYALWSEHIVKLHQRLDEYRWMAVIWDRHGMTWSPAVYAIDEQMIDAEVRDPQSMQCRSTG